MAYRVARRSVVGRSGGPVLVLEHLSVAERSPILSFGVYSLEDFVMMSSLHNYLTFNFMRNYECIVVVK